MITTNDIIENDMKKSLKPLNHRNKINYNTMI